MIPIFSLRLNWRNIDQKAFREIPELTVGLFCWKLERMDSVSTMISKPHNQRWRESAEIPKLKEKARSRRNRKQSFYDRERKIRRLLSDLSSILVRSIPVNEAKERVSFLSFFMCFPGIFDRYVVWFIEIFVCLRLSNKIYSHAIVSSPSPRVRAPRSLSFPRRDSRPRMHWVFWIGFSSDQGRKYKHRVSKIFTFTDLRIRKFVGGRTNAKYVFWISRVLIIFCDR